MFFNVSINYNLFRILSKNKFLNKIKKFHGQDYDALKSIHNESKLFEDPYFAADQISINHDLSTPDYEVSDVQWLRPWVII